MLISPPNPDVSKADGTNSYIEIDGKNYCIDHSEQVYFGEDVMYRWSVAHVSNGESV